MQSDCGCTTTPSVRLHGLAWRSPGCLVSNLENKEDRDTSQISEGSLRDSVIRLFSNPVIESSTRDWPARCAADCAT
jgi:hypothetical protein